MKDKYDDGAPLAYFLRAKKTRAIHPETSDLLRIFLQCFVIKARTTLSLI